jgi:predicted nucleic acid-binding protein
LTFVLDASVTLAFVFPDERDAAAIAVAASLQQHGAIAPILWAWEVQNAILVSERRGRILKSRAMELIADVGALPVELEPGPTFGVEASFALRFGLSIYDAIYLELAFRHGIALATRDRALQAAAHELGLTTKGIEE